jgi:hypothetical protein
MRWNAQGWPTHVLWNEVNARTNGDVGKPVIVPVADVIDAMRDGAHVAAVLLPPHTHLPERVFEVVRHQDGRETIGLVKSAHAGSTMEMKDIASLDEAVPRAPLPERKVRKRSARTYAVSQVQLDDDGRVTDVLWGRVDTAKNAWAEAETVVPVTVVVAALQAGDRVFALFPATNGHLPDRQFVQADYDGGRQTIVLFGPTAVDRDIHDMDRMAPGRSHRAE